MATAVQCMPGGWRPPDPSNPPPVAARRWLLFSNQLPGTMIELDLEEWGEETGKLELEELETSGQGEGGSRRPGQLLGVSACGEDDLKEMECPMSLIEADKEYKKLCQQRQTEVTRGPAQGAKWQN